MSVDPLKSNAPSHARAQLSAASPCLADGTDQENRVPERTVSPERILAVLRRLHQGYYSSAEVQDKVVRAVRKDLILSRPE